jgi:hypothetical protein
MVDGSKIVGLIMLHEVGWVDRVFEGLLEEQAAGRRRISRERTEQFDQEQDAGRHWEERAQKRLELEQEQGRRIAARRA